MTLVAVAVAVAVGVGECLGLGNPGLGGGMHLFHVDAQLAGLGPLLAAAIAVCFPSAPGAHPAEPDEAERLVAAVGFDRLY